MRFKNFYYDKKKSRRINVKEILVKDFEIPEEHFICIFKLLELNDLKFLFFT